MTLDKLNALWDAIDALEYDELCTAMACLLTKGLQTADTFAVDVAAKLDMIAMLAGIRDQLESKSCAH